MQTVFSKDFLDLTLCYLPFDCTYFWISICGALVFVDQLHHKVKCQWI